MKVIVIGGERLAYHFAKLLIAKGYRVTLINKDPEFCKELSKKLRIPVIHGDGSKRQILEEAEVMPNDVLVALTPKDQDNLVITMLAKEIFGTRRVVARVNDPENKEVFQALGITSVSPTELIAEVVSQLTIADDIKSYFPISKEAELTVLEIAVDESSPVVNKKLKDIELPHESIVGAILRQGSVIIPRGETSILKDDRLFVFCHSRVQSEVLKTITGEV
ncbi:MAG: trk/ktr system potassium uptake protein [Thermotogota bacterium]|nr:trk/ktr system potassium uptake protein [Thermotogota bacterium]MDK2864685.1 trk/ktr system potassium uptake protein [Thermotogota bacterium]HCZ06256.1 potassium transporter TrkA [Thermotogota bacterium]